MQIVFASGYKYFMHASPIDMRKGCDGLHGIVLQTFNKEVLSDEVFIFLNKHRNKIKLLHWQGDGFAIFYKRLEKGTYEIPLHQAGSKSILLSPQQLQFILDGIVLKSIQKRRRYEQLIVNK